MYEGFFGLRERPFDLTTNPRFLFLTPRHREALSTLRYVLSAPRGLTILLGDAEAVWETIVDDARNHRLRPRYESTPGVRQLKRTLPRRDVCKGKGSLPVTLMQFSRGCRCACDFCAISV